MELIVISGPNKGRRVDLSGARSIGRDEMNDLVLPHEFVSGRHALIRFGRDGSAEITDLSSKNGTWVNGVRVMSSVSVAAGAAIQIGEDILQVVAHQHDLPRPVPSYAVEPLTEPPPPPSAVCDAGPVAGRDVSIAGDQAAGRDLHYHEGFQIKSRMRRPARRVLHWGVFLFIAGNLAGFGGFAVFQAEILQAMDKISLSESGSADAFPQGPDTANIAFGMAIVGVGGVVSFVGLMMVVVSLLMRRERVRKPVATRGP